MTPEAVAEREAVVRWLREQEAAGADKALQAEEGSARWYALGGGSLAIKQAADAIAAGQHRGGEPAT